jgi:hypothetical protein
MFSKIKNLFRKKENKPEVENIINNIKSRIAKSNGYTTEQFSLAKPKEDKELIPDYLNKDCNDLNDFIISPELSVHDLKKLCKLNNINLQVSSGWHSMLISLLVELDAAGWDRRVSCIKEKYASLAFYTAGKYDEIIEKFESLSGQVCETCGEKGNQRFNTGWDYVACRKHYLENRGFIKAMDSGFELNGKLYLWKNVENTIFEDIDSETYEPLTLTLTFNTNSIAHPGWRDNKLYISKGTIGYGEFLAEIPRRFENLDYLFIDRYSNPSPCMICGFIAVYGHVCECCENQVWISKEKNYSDKEEYIKDLQCYWIEDEGPQYSDSYKIYLKDESYKIISNPDDKRLHF